MEATLRACADYHRSKSQQHQELADNCFNTEQAKHYLARAALHEQWRAAIEETIAKHS